jgi:SAM-dependent methyltransferase
MDSETQRRLVAINRRFYALRAGEFSATRDAPWPGWYQLLPELRRLADAAAREGRALRVLDAGCGNGRFARFLAAELAPAIRTGIEYLGVDTSAELLAHAKHAGDALARCALLRAELALGAGALAGLRSRFDAAACFGVLHHVPAAEARRALLAALAASLRAGGILVVSAWQFAEDPRLAGRTLAWDVYNRRAAEPIDPAQLEAGDTLLPFGAALELPRYCHGCSAAEIRALGEGLPLELRAEFRSEARGDALNLYSVLERLPM